jgi:polyhydroxyalkanoate synthesis regulator phasin
VNERLDRIRRAEEQRSEIKQKIHDKINDIIENEVERVRKPKEIVATKLEFDELSSVKDFGIG